MTWVIGGTTAFGYSFGISDIQVTYKNKSTRDCLQKICGVGDYIALGFSGSVKIGFAMLDVLSRYLQAVPPGNVWHPEYVVNMFQIMAQNIFEKSDKEEKDRDCRLMFIGADPRRTENELGSRTYLYRLYAPYFKPLYTKPEQLVSVGIGNKVDRYMKMLRQINNSPNFFWRMEASHQGAGTAHFIKRKLTFLLRENPAKGISPHLHTCIVRLGQLDVFVNDMSTLSKEGAAKFAMPKVATSYSEFDRMTRQRGIAAEAASC
ncbi:MAG: hypothetical protein HY231_09105 [Acidobacteria bacterium]|nr:hypothetical protein [Acidobacteriota bacterium]